MGTTTDVQYHIVPSRPEAHIYTVTCTIPQPDPDGQVFSMPAWIPGSYMIRDFSKNIVVMQAHSEGREIAIEKQDKHTWQCAPVPGTLSIVYEVYAWDLSVRGAHLDTTHGYFNGAGVFICVHGRELQPCTIYVLQPAGETYAQWRVATALPREDAELHGFGRYKASSYDELIDHPVEMGTFELASFEVAGVPHEIALTGRHRADLARLGQDLTKVCAQHVSLFGELPDMERYLFQVMAVGDGYGGLEHRASTSLLCSRYDLPMPGETEISERYRGFLGLCSHEYFHTWNVKRIKPAAFTPYNLNQETHTRLLWMFEGITSYYDDLALVRSGLIGAESYLELLGQMITRVLRGSGRFRQSVSDSSFDAWTKFYKQDDNAQNAIVSYYAKGAMIAMALDLLIRLGTQQLYSLDNVMRMLWEKYGKTGIGVPEQGVEQQISELVGLDLKDFFDCYVRGTEDMPLQEYLQPFGVSIEMRVAESEQDKGGKPATKPVKEGRRSVLGVRTAEAPGGVQITHVLESGAAQAAGIAAGDVVIAMEGLRVNAKDLETRLTMYRPGETVTLHVFRRDELLQMPVILQAAEADTCVLRIGKEGLTDLGKNWLGLPVA